MLFFSIITVNYNNAKGLKKTLESLSVQTFKDFELLIIDGGSTDNSVEVIEEYKSIVQYWVSEKDNGIYDAMNKGIVKANGTYLLFLNSGDFLADEKVLEYIKNLQSSESLVIGSYRFEPEQISYTTPEPFSFSDFWFKNPICHQTVFIHKTAFDLLGLYKTEYSVVADWLFFLDAIFKYQLSYKVVQQDIAVIEKGGLSSSSLGFKKANEQRLQAYQLYYKGFISDYELLNLYKRRKLHNWVAAVYRLLKR